MARLFLLRHAKSAWDNTSLADIDRPLNLRGRSSAALMGRHMADHALVPDRVLCSSSRRTRETFAAILPFLKDDFETRFSRGLYLAPASAMIRAVREGGGSAKTLMVIGHNPGMQETALSLIGRGNPDIVSAIHDKFPTGSLAVIDFDGDDWLAVGPGRGRVVAFFRPRELEVVGAPEAVEVDE